MCLNHRNIINRSKRLELSPKSSFRLDVPCGSCCECQSMKYSEYLFRSYYHALATTQKGGFCYFDTLTYKDESLPSVSKITGYPLSHDFPCFSRNDVRLFFVRLRRALSRAGYDVKGNLSYFLTSEYGSREDCTHRPHYHVIFFVSFDIHPYQFSKFVSAAWPHGRTDGAPFKSCIYVLNHVYGKYGSNQYPLLKLVNYVCKYVVKSSTFKGEIIKRVNQIVSDESWNREEYLQWLECKYGKEIKRDLFDDRKFKSFLYRLCCEFHLQSNGFGLDALNYHDLTQVANDGYFRFYDPKKIVRSIPIPVYFQRKMFYQLVNDFRGCAHWELTSQGQRFKSINRLKSVDVFVDKFQSWFDGLCGLDLTTASNFLGSRSIRQFVEYLLFYKGRLKPSDMKIEPLDVWAVRLSDFDCNDPKKDVFVYNYTDKKDFGLPLLSWRWFGDRQTETFERPFRHYKPVLCDCCSFEQKYVINQNTDISFIHFDDLFAFYSQNNISRNEKKQSTSDAIDRLRLLLNH